MNPACDVAPDELIAFTEEDLPERRMKQLEAHVPICPRCQQRLADSESTMMILRESMPEPDQRARHDLLIRLYQEADRQTDHPHRRWTQAASLTAVGATFLVAAFLLWTGLGQFIDAIPQPFQRATSDQSIEWVDSGQTPTNIATGEIPETIGETFQLSEYDTQAGITTMIYESTEFETLGLQVTMFPDDGADPPPGIDQIQTADGITIQVDDPDAIREIRWAAAGVAYHVQLTVEDPESPAWMTADQAEAIVRTFDQ
jgi:hypothetical protein